jgi:UDP-glucuronate decarboxylase
MKLIFRSMIFFMLCQSLWAKTIVVTGGAGFIGSNRCKHLLQRGDRVICIDNFSSGSMDNISHLKDNPLFTLIVHDIIGAFTIAEPVDEIYNLACPASPIYYQKDPVETLRINFLGMQNLLELAREKNAKVLQSSTSEVYGDPLEHPQKEEYWGNVNTFGPRACYDEGKRITETLCYSYREKYGTDVKIVRIFNTYGPKMKASDGRVVSSFITQALQNKPLTVFGDGSQTRSLCYIDDMIRGLVLMMESKDFTGPVNLGNPSKEITVINIAHTVIGLTKSSSTISFHPLPPDDPKKRRPDITLAKDKLGWSPEVSLEEGLSKTIEYYRAELSK